MNTKSIHDVFSPLPAWSRSTLPELSDACLLQQFRETGEEKAFAALVERHGPMVLGVCRRLLDWSQAEDAFQATFLVLLRKAREIRQPELLGNWLYGVAYRVSMRLRSQQGQQPLPLRPEEKAMRDTAEEVSLRELEHVIDEEIQHLPERFRQPLVLCCLEGKSYEEAAHALKCSEGTLKSRLSRARSQLQSRLENRGWKVAGATLGLLLSTDVLCAAVPPLLQELAVGKLLQLAGKNASVVEESGKIQHLADEELRSLAGQTGRAQFLRLGFLALAAGGVALLLYLAMNNTTPPVSDMPTSPPVAITAPPLMVPQNIVLQDCWPKVLQFDAPVAAVALNQVGSKIAVLCKDHTIHVRSTVNEMRFAVIQGKAAQLKGLAFSADGLKVASLAEQDSCLLVFDTSAGKELHKLGGMGDSHFPLRQPFVFSPDGQWIACATATKNIVLWHLDSGGVQLLPTSTDAAGWPLGFSPDGKLLAYVDAPDSLLLRDLASAKVVHHLTATDLRPHALSFSTDGHSLACASTTGSLHIWDTGSGAVRHWLGVNVAPNPADARKSFYHSIAFANKNAWLLAARPDKIDVWDHSQGKKLGFIQPYSAPPHGLACNSNGDGVMVATVSDERTVMIWATAPKVLGQK